MSGGHYEIPAKLGLEVANALGASLTMGWTPLDYKVSKYQTDII